MERIIKIFAKSIIALFCLSLFASVIQHVSQGGTRYGFLTEPIRVFSSLPGYFKEAVSSVKEAPRTFIKTPNDFKAINNLDEDVNVLMSFTNENSGRSVKLFNLKNNEVTYEWTLPGNFEEHYRLLNPVLFPNKDLCYSVAGYTGVTKIDSIGNLLWQQSGIISHHSLNQDVSGNIWMCASKSEKDGVVYDGAFIKKRATLPFIDDLIVQLDVNDGKILFKKSLTSILKENNLLYLLKKTNHLEDPYHTNDVEPILVTSEHYQAGDVLISIRHLSLILHYRPSSNKVLETIEGPFSFQHDVDVKNDSVISIFNNNEIFGVTDELGLKSSESPINIDVSNSNIVEYNFKTKNFKVFYDSLFNANNIYTGTEGLYQSFNSNLVFIEQQNSGLLWVIKENEVLYKNVLESHIEGYHHLPNWLRIIE